VFHVRQHGDQESIYVNELESLTCLFYQTGIEVVALKGVCFVLTVYLDIALRPMGDMDLLVTKAKLAEAIAIAKSLYYVTACASGFCPL
jgi:hypothetical protein